MRKHLLVSISSVLVWSAFPLLAAGESFEVIVLRGSEVVKVIGDSDGAVSEVTLRKAPTLPAVPSAEKAQPKANPPDELVVVVNEILPAVVGGWPVLLGPSLPKPMPVLDVSQRNESGGETFINDDLWYDVFSQAAQGLGTEAAAGIATTAT